MTTLHALRRRHKLSLSELARRTGIPMRRLAEYEYESHPLGQAEHEAIAAFFRIHAQNVTGGIVLSLPGAVSGSRQPNQTYLLATLAATAALVLSLRLSLASPALVSMQPRTAAGVSAGVHPPLTRARPTPSAATLPRPAPIVANAARADAVPVAMPSRTAEPAPPHQCPLETKRGVIVAMAVQGAGTRTPPAVGLDLAVDTDGDGFAELWATRGATVVAAHAGTVTVVLNTWPAGNYVSIEGADGWRSGYSHLQVVDVHTGEQVVTGQQLGLVGNTGQAGGPHLKIGVWQHGTSVDPATLLSCK